VTRDRFVSATYLLTSVGDFLESVTFRMLADGMLLQDIRLAATSVRSWEGWPAFWMNVSSVHEGHADEALRYATRQTTASHLLRSSLCAHYAQFMAFDMPEPKARAAIAKIELFRRASSLLEPAAELIGIPFDGATLPAYLRVPGGIKPTPVVVLVGGLDATKEDAHQMADLCLQRGCAVLAFDGPGQGEAYVDGLRFSPDSPRAIGAVLDHIETRAELDASRVGVLGRSLGGNLAARAAAEDPRIAACVVWGGPYDLGNLDAKPPLIQAGYQFITGLEDWSDAKALLAGVTVAGSSRSITCPLLIVQGTLDNSVPVTQAQRLAAEVPQSTLWLFEGSIHCCHDVAHVVRPAMVDWLVGRLTAPTFPAGSTA